MKDMLVAIGNSDGSLKAVDYIGRRKTVIEKWLANQKSELVSVFQNAIKALNREGIRPEQITTKFVSESVDAVAKGILAEAEAGGYQTLVIGQCGRSRTAHFLLGSIASKIINTAVEITVCVVG